MGPDGQVCPLTAETVLYGVILSSIWTVSPSEMAREAGESCRTSKRRVNYHEKGKGEDVDRFNMGNVPYLKICRSHRYFLKMLLQPRKRSTCFVLVLRPAFDTRSVFAAAAGAHDGRLTALVAISNLAKLPSTEWTDHVQRHRIPRPALHLARNPRLSRTHAPIGSARFDRHVQQVIGLSGIERLDSEADAHSTQEGNIESSRLPICDRVVAADVLVPDLNFDSGGGVDGDSLPCQRIMPASSARCPEGVDVPISAVQTCTRWEEV